MKRSLKPILLLVFIAGMLLAVATLPVREGMSVAISWIEDHRTLAWIIYIATYTVATVLVIPGSILTLGAGFLFGLPVGVMVVSIGSLLGAASAFLVGRFLARLRGIGVPRVTQCLTARGERTSGRRHRDENRAQ